VYIETIDTQLGAQLYVLKIMLQIYKVSVKIVFFLHDNLCDKYAEMVTINPHTNKA